MNKRPFAASRERLEALLTANKGRGYHDVQNAGEVAEVWLYDEIGFWGVTDDAFARQVAPLKASQITVHLNSPGGDAWQGQGIYNTLRQHQAEVRIQVEGLAASAASTIAMAASPGELVMARGSMMMIHEAWLMGAGNKRELRDAADWLAKLDDSIAGFYAERAGGKAADWLTVMEAETWYSDRETVDAGLADKVDGDADPASNIFDLSAFLNTPSHLQQPVARDADRKLSKRDAERALRDAGWSAAAAKALVSRGWEDDSPRDEVELAAFIRSITPVTAGGQ